MVVLINRGARIWDLNDAVEVNGKLVRRMPLKDGTWNSEEKVVKRRLKPGESIEALDEKEAKHLLGYKEIVDAEKAIPQVTDKIAALTKERDDLAEQVRGLVAKLAKYEDDSDGKEKGKGKK